MKVTIRVTKADIKKAIEAKGTKPYGIAVCCPVFQALSRKRVMVTSVGWSVFNTSEGSLDLPKCVRKLTEARSSEWPKFLRFKKLPSFTLDIPKRYLRRGQVSATRAAVADTISLFVEDVMAEASEVWFDWDCIWTKAPDGAIARQHAEGWNDLAEAITLLRKAEAKLRKTV